MCSTFCLLYGPSALTLQIHLNELKGVENNLAIQFQNWVHLNWIQSRHLLLWPGAEEGKSKKILHLWDLKYYRKYYHSIQWKRKQVSFRGDLTVCFYQCWTASILVDPIIFFWSESDQWSLPTLATNSQANLYCWDLTDVTLAVFLMLRVKGVLAVCWWELRAWQLLTAFQC